MGNMSEESDVPFIGRKVEGEEQHKNAFRL